MPVATRTAASPSTEMVTLSLISHTNAGKTSLARTLLRRDVGEIRDAPHVTLFNEQHVLLREDQTELRLWDTPGFGDSTRLLKRLQREKNALLWFLSQVWDRVTDRPLWCGQQALKNVRDEADVILYLVNAGEPPEAATFIAPEMEILSWIDKPVIVLLNQTGPAAGGQTDEQEVHHWSEYLKTFPQVKSVLSLDAFARCWVQEDRLMAEVGKVLPPNKLRSFAVLQKAWRDHNLTIFEDATRLLADLLSSAVLDGETVRAESVWEKMGVGRSEINREYGVARQALAARLAERVERTTDALILLHGLDGKADQVATSTLHRQFFTPDKISESIWGVLGSFAGGAMGGLIADLKMGGLTFGGGALLGGLATGLTTYAVIRSYNLVRGNDHRLHWSREHFREQVRLALLCYLAVAHFGRGRGPWQESEGPAQWKHGVAKLTENEAPSIDELWKLGVEQQAIPEVVVREAHRLVKRLTMGLLREFYGVV